MTGRMTIFLLLGLLLTVDAAAQRRILGTVTDGYREPLPGATIMVKERPTLGAVTMPKDVTNCGCRITGVIR